MARVTLTLLVPESKVAITEQILRRVMENRAALPLVEELMENGVHHTTYVIQNLDAKIASLEPATVEN